MTSFTLTSAWFVTFCVLRGFAHGFTWTTCPFQKKFWATCRTTILISFKKVLRNFGIFLSSIFRIFFFFFVCVWRMFHCRCHFQKFLHKRSSEVHWFYFWLQYTWKIIRLKEIKNPLSLCSFELIQSSIFTSTLNPQFRILLVWFYKRSWAFGRFLLP